MFSGTGWNHSCCHSSLEDSHEHPRVIFRHFCKFLSIQKKKKWTKTGALKHTIISVDSSSYSRVFTLQSLAPSPPPSSLCFDRTQPVSSPESLCTSYRSGWTEAGSGNTVDEGPHQDVSACGATACGRRGVLPCSNTLRLPVPHNLTPNLDSPCQSVQLGHSCSVSLFISNFHPCFLFPSSSLFALLS